MKKILIVLASTIVICFNLNAYAALSASVSVSPSSARINQPVVATVAISNTGSAMTLTGLKITATYNGAPTSKVPAAFSVYNPSDNVALAANLTTSVPMRAVFFAPSTGVTGTGTGLYYIGATFTTSDGSITSATSAAQVEVNSLSNLDSTD